MKHKHKSKKRKQGKAKQRRGTPRPRHAGQTLPPPETTAETSGRVLGLEPMAPLIIRSGRPFDHQAGVDPAHFPPPSTTTGCLRTAWARQTGQPFGLELARIDVAGPLLARPDAAGGLCLLVPKPADALYFGHGAGAVCVRAEPRPYPSGCGADLPSGLVPVQLARPRRDKPGDGPAWWAWEDLLAYRGGQDVDYATLSAHGWSPVRGGERRTHIAIDPGTGAADPGRLFQTEGLELASGGLTDGPGTGLRLLVRSAEPLAAGLVHLGGKRRLAAMEPVADEAWPSPPRDWCQRIRRAGGLSLTLLTPALFNTGFRPGWLDEDLRGSPPEAPGLRLQLVAVASERWQPHSGWDLARRRPRPNRKLVKAGATYWLRILGDPGEDAIDALWLTSLCDAEQDRKDGFGLALPAPWTELPTDHPSSNPD